MANSIGYLLLCMKARVSIAPINWGDTRMVEGAIDERKRDATTLIHSTSDQVLAFCTRTCTCRDDEDVVVSYRRACLSTNRGAESPAQVRAEELWLA